MATSLTTAGTKIIERNMKAAGISASSTVPEGSISKRTIKDVTNTDALKATLLHVSHAFIRFILDVTKTEAGPNPVYDAVYKTFCKLLIVSSDDNVESRAKKREELSDLMEMTELCIVNSLGSDFDAFQNCKSQYEKDLASLKSAKMRDKAKIKALKTSHAEDMGDIQYKIIRKLNDDKRMVHLEGLNLLGIYTGKTMTSQDRTVAFTFLQKMFQIGAVHFASSRLPDGAKTLMASVGKQAGSRSVKMSNLLSFSTRKVMSEGSEKIATDFAERIGDEDGTIVLSRFADNFQTVANIMTSTGNMKLSWEKSEKKPSSKSERLRKKREKARAKIAGK